MIYLDNASTTQVDPIVLEAMMPYLTEQYGNPGTIYSFGRNAKKAVEKARVQVASFIGAKPKQIIFTSGGTESNNMVFSALADKLQADGKSEIVSTAIEHDSVIKAINSMCIKTNFDSHFVCPNEQGVVSFPSVSIGDYYLKELEADCYHYKTSCRKQAALKIMPADSS